MNRIAVVTGANRGIGREVARQLADQGDVVYLTASPPGRRRDHRRRAGRQPPTCTRTSSMSPTHRASIDWPRPSKRSIAAWTY